VTVTARDVGWSRGGRLVVDGVSLRPAPGTTVGLLGPNGSGKSSLIRLLQGAARPDTGAVELDGVPLATQSRRTVARRIATVTQHAETDAALTVRDVVELGRIPHRTVLGGDRTRDADAVDGALRQVGLSDRADASWHRLSGGERQRAQIARALAQEPTELLMDEPTNHLDIKHQLELLRLVAELPVTTVVALHDLNLAAAYCDTVLVLAAGRAVAAGSPEDVLTEDLVADVYGVRARRTTRPDTGRVALLFDPF